MYPLFWNNSYLKHNYMQDLPLQIIEYKGQTINIHTDCYTENPRDWDNLGILACKHREYNLGDKKHDLDFDEIEQSLDDQLKKYPVVLPVYLYDHSGITMNTTGFSCPWDSGQVGVIYATREDIIKEFGKIDKKTKDRVREVLISEVKTYNQYISGEVYGYIAGDDSCWGYYDMEQAIEEAKAIIDYNLEKELKEKTKKTKAKILNHVPLTKR